MDLDARVAAFRAFNRAWTAKIGVLDAKLHDTPFSLTEARVLFELAQARSQDVAVGALREQLALDAGYLSRILARFERDKLIAIEAARGDARKQVARLTAVGRRAFATLDARAARDVAALLGAYSDAQQQRLVAAMGEIERVIEPRRPGVVVLRAPRAGDLGWVVERHGAIYAREYGWSDEFEGLVATIVGEYVAKRDREREAVWIAELDGERAGSVFCVQKSATVAKLRLLLVEPTARGHGIGRRLVDECIAFARDRGYKKLTLWTNSVLISARKIYEAAGFTLVASSRHRAFGHDLVEQTWDLDLR